MQQVKVFKPTTHGMLERDINEWLQSTGCNHEFIYKVIDIKYQLDYGQHGALVWYSVEKRTMEVIDKTHSSAPRLKLPTGV